MSNGHELMEGPVGPAWDALSGSARGPTRLSGSVGTGESPAE